MAHVLAGSPLRFRGAQGFRAIVSLLDIETVQALKETKRLVQRARTLAVLLSFDRFQYGLIYHDPKVAKYLGATTME